MGERSSLVDWARVTRWTEEISVGALKEVSSAFAAKRARGPTLVWNPMDEEPTVPQLRFLLRYWRDLAGDQPLPLASAVDAMEMRPALGYILLLDVEAGGRDFRYRLYGSILAAVSGFDVTGKLVSEHFASRHVVEFALAGYHAVLRRREPLLTDYGPAPTVNTWRWQRLVLPLADTEGATIRFLVGNVPLTRAGQPITQRL